MRSSDQLWTDIQTDHHPLRSHKWSCSLGDDARSAGDIQHAFTPLRVRGLDFAQGANRLGTM